MRCGAYSGKLNKKGHLIKSWKLRDFTLIDNILTYSDKNVEKGNYIIDNTSTVKISEDIDDYKYVFILKNSKGELGWYIQSDGGPKPKRLRIHSPAFMNIQVLPEIVEGRLLADVITTIASLDPVMGEIDR